MTLPAQLLFFPTLGPMEIFVLFVVVLILFGPGKLPQVFGAFGDGVKQFKKASRDVTEEINSHTEEKTDTNKTAEHTS